MPPHALDSAFDRLRREFDAACQQAASQTCAEQIQKLNQLFRRFRAYQTESEWVQITLEAASQYAEYVALFFVSEGNLRLQGQTPFSLLSEGTCISVSSAAAFQNAIASKDPVTALRHPSEVSRLLSQGYATERAHVFPITNGDRVSAILFASDSRSDPTALELISGFASSVLDRKANMALHAQIAETPRAVAPTIQPTDSPIELVPLEPSAVDGVVRQEPEEKALEPEILQPADWDHLPEAEMLTNEPVIEIPVVYFPVIAEPAFYKPPMEVGKVPLIMGPEPTTTTSAIDPEVPTAEVVEEKAEVHAPMMAADPAVLAIAKTPATNSSGSPLPPVLPAWSDLPMEQRQLHIRAQRFARVAVAEIQLARPEACRAGREQSDLYLFLKREIDKARENYRKQFMTVPSMVDYLHLELIQTAAQGDEHKLGADYPGRLL